MPVAEQRIRNWASVLVASLLAASFLPLCAARLHGQEPTAVPRPPSSVKAIDHPWDAGDRIVVVVGLSPDDAGGAEAEGAIQYLVQSSGEYGGLYTDVALLGVEQSDRGAGEVTFVLEKCELGEPYFFRVRTVGHDGVRSDYVETPEAARATRQWFDGSRFYFGLISLLICGSVVLFIGQARRGRPLYIRKIAALEAVEEAVGRATEMGRSCLFVPGIMDMNDIQTIAGITVLSRVAQVAAEYGTQVEVPTSRSLVMTTARETVQSAFLSAGRPDAYNEDLIYYVTDEQFGFVAYLSGMMAREKPAACFYMGAFYAESLILAETGNSIGAIQVAGTAMPAQLPFFVAACDYTLIGEEFFAASAYLSGEAEQLGSLKGQDVGKLIVGVLLIAGCALATLEMLTDASWVRAAGEYLRDTILK